MIPLEKDALTIKMNECGVPLHLQDGFILYLIHGIEPGGCITAILANDLMESFGRADFQTSYNMKQICVFIYSYTPRECHGSYERVEEWMKHRRGVLREA